MAKILVNAINLRSAGGLQVVGGLLSRFSEENSFHILWNDAQSRDRIKAICGNQQNVTFENPCQTASNAKAFLWLLIKFGAYCRQSECDLVFNVNMHVPSGRLPQIVYHMNVLRFDRPSRPIWLSGELADRLRDWRARKALSSAQINVFESQYLAGVAEVGARSITGKEVIYIGLDENHMLSRKPEPVADPQPHLIALTSPAAHKDNDILLKTLKELVQRRPEYDWRLKIAGGRTADAFSDLKQLAAELEISARLDWLGFKSHDELADIGNKCLCLISASRVESFCMVAVEAMSWGCPPIVVDATSMPESIGEAGWLVEPRDVDGFADKIIELYENLDQRLTLAYAGLTHASQMSWSSAAADFEILFDRMMGDRK